MYSIYNGEDDGISFVGALHVFQTVFVTVGYPPVCPAHFEMKWGKGSVNESV